MFGLMNLRQQLDPRNDQEVLDVMVSVKAEEGMTMICCKHMKWGFCENRADRVCLHGNAGNWLRQMSHIIL